MAKKKNTVWICQSCGTRAYKWAGYCTGCGEWNTISEEVLPDDRPARGIGAAAGSSSRPVAVESSWQRPRFSAVSDRMLGGMFQAPSL